MTSTIAEHLHILSKERPQSDDPEVMNGFILLNAVNGYNGWLNSVHFTYPK